MTRFSLSAFIRRRIRPDRNARYDRETVAVLKRVLGRDSNAIDVGAHAGDILRHIVSIAPNGAHHAFEPLPHLAAGLVQRFPRVAVHGVALSDTAGAARFQFVESNPGYSGLLRRRYDRPHEDVTEIDVVTARLDDMLPPDMRVDFIKIDVEGAELQVLRGAMDTMRRCRPVIVLEHGLGGADVYGTRPQDVYRLLHHECGLDLSLMADWLAGRLPLDESRFVACFDSGSDYYFMAHPPRTGRAG